MKKTIIKGVGKTKKQIRNEKLYIKKCWNCRSKFLYQREDINYNFDDFSWVSCPECHANCDILFKKRYRGDRHE